MRKPSHPTTFHALEITAMGIQQIIVVLFVVSTATPAFDKITTDLLILRVGDSVGAVGLNVRRCDRRPAVLGNAQSTP